MAATQPQAFDRRKGGRRLLVLFFWWIWISPERRFYAGAVFCGLALSVWTGYMALVAQGRLPAPTFRLPNIEDISLPGRPVMIPVVPFGSTSSAFSNIGRGGDWLVVNKEDSLFGRTFIPASNGARELMLVLTSNLPRLQVGAPPIANFRSLRLFELDVVEADTRKKVDWRGHDVEVRIEIRSVDLDYARDASALFLLHYDTVLNQWEDTRAVVEDGFLVATINTLSPFAVGYVEVESGVQGERAPTQTPTPAPAATGTATPTAGDGGTATPAPAAAVGAPAATPGTGDGTGADGDGDGNPDVPPDTTPDPLATQVPAPTAAGTPIVSPFGTPTVIIPTNIPVVVVLTPQPTATPLPTATPQTAPSESPGGGDSPPATATPSGPTPTPGPVPVIGLARPGGGSVNGLFNAMVSPGSQTSANLILSNEGSVDFVYTLSSTATASSQLDSNPSLGLQIEVYRCGNSFGPSCATLIYSGPVMMSSVPLGGPQTVGTGGSQNGLRPASFDYLQIRVTLPPAAGSSFRSTQSVLSFTWNATQAF